MKSVNYKSPYRVDLCAGADLRQVAIPFEYYRPCAFNFTIDKYVHVEVSEYTPEYILINGHEYHISNADMTNKYDKLAVYACMALNISGISINTHSDLANCSGLGGSSATMVALISALYRYRTEVLHDLGAVDEYTIMEEAHHIENSIPGMNTGLQDQGAAIYGGVNLWTIHYTGVDYPSECGYYIPDHTTDVIGDMCSRKAPLDPNVHKFLLDRSILVYTNKEHDSSIENDSQISAYLNPSSRSTWLRTFELSRLFYDSAADMDSGMCIKYMNAMLDIRRSRLTITADMATIIATSSLHECGVSICGAGGGGYMWLFSDNISSVAKLFEDEYEVIYLGG